MLLCIAHARRMLLKQRTMINPLLNMLWSKYCNCPKRAVPVLESLSRGIKEAYLKVLPKSVIGKALGYSILRWPQLMLYTTDGKLNINNNRKLQKAVGLGRKNYLFAHPDEPAKRSAMFYSQSSTCKLHGITLLIWL